MSKSLTFTLGPVADETARFVDLFDKFFDSLNVSNFDSGKHERKPFKDPYRSSSDFRLKVRHDHALAYTIHAIIIIIIITVVDGNISTIP